VFNLFINSFYTFKNKEKNRKRKNRIAKKNGKENIFLSYYDAASLFIGKNYLMCFQRLPFVMIRNLKSYEDI
jgi:hypothetical protein